MLDSTATVDVQVGYTNWAVIPTLPPITLISPSFDLDRAAGVRLDFELRVDFESHENVHRSGFSVVVITNDLQGIELGF